MHCLGDTVNNVAGLGNRQSEQCTVRDDVSNVGGLVTQESRKLKTLKS